MTFTTWEHTYALPIDWAAHPPKKKRRKKARKGKK